MSQRVHELDQSNFAETVLKAPGPVLVDFSASWCPPCKLLMPRLESYALRSAGRVTVATLDVDRGEGIAAGYEIHSVPTLLLFEHGRVIGRQVGLVSESAIERFVEAHLTVEEEVSTSA